MNVLIVASKFPPEYSGPGIRMPRLYKEIGPRIGIKNLSVLCGGIEHTDNGEYLHEGIPVKRITAAYIRERKFPFLYFGIRWLELAASFVENIKGMRAFARMPRPDYIHIVGTSGVTAAALLWSRIKDIPVFQEIVNADSDPSQRIFLFFKVKAPENSVIVTMDKNVRRNVESLGFKNQIWHRPNPLDEKIFKPVSIDEKHKLRAIFSPFADTDIVILSIGKFIQRKNQIFLIDVLKNLPDQYKLILAGPAITKGALFNEDFRYIESIQQKIREYNLEKRVHVSIGFVQSDAYMKAADIYAIPGYNEGFGTPMMESIACGVGVIANENNSSFSEWLENGENSALCPLDAQIWAEAAQKIYKIPEDKKHAASQNVKRIAGNQVIFENYVNLIKKITTK